MLSQNSKYLIKKAGINLLTTLSPTTVSLICTQQTAKLWFVSLLPSNTFPFLYKPAYQVIIIVIICVLIPMAITVICEGKEMHTTKKIAQLYNLLLSYIQHSVNIKKKRFYQEIGKHTSNSAIFMNITQPLLQIEDLLSGLCNLFTDYYGISDIKGTIITCKDGKLKDYLVVCGDDQPTTTILQLSRNNSLAKATLNSRKICVAEDANTDKNFYHPQGCIISSAVCFPIFRGSDICMIACLTSKTEYSFKRSLTEQYKQIFSYFESRMLLESYLLELKSQNKQNNNEKKCL